MDAKADFIVGSATVSYNPEKVTPSQMVKAINDQSFFRASLPTGEDVSSNVTTSRVNFLPFVVVGIIVLLGGILIWSVIIRRQNSQSAESQTL